MFLFTELVHDKQMEIAPSNLMNMFFNNHELMEKSWKFINQEVGEKDAKSPRYKKKMRWRLRYYREIIQNAQENCPRE